MLALPTLVRGAAANTIAVEPLETGSAERAIPQAAMDPTQHRGWAELALSVLLHSGIAMATIYLLPAAPSEIARGGVIETTEVLVIGAEEFAALQEGAKPAPITVSVVVPDIVPVEMPPVEVPPVPAPVPDAAVLQVEPSPPEPVPAEPSPVEMMIPLPDPEIVLPPALTAPPRSATPLPEKARVAQKPKADVAKTNVAKLPPKREPARREKPVETPVADPSPNPAARGRSGQGEAAANRAASARGGSGGVNASAGSAAISSYRARVIAHLTRFKDYPEQAQDRGITGRNAITITLTRDGRVSTSALSNGSGHAMLDTATLAALRRAQPFPAMPEGGPATFTLTIGMRYDLR